MTDQDVSTPTQCAKIVKATDPDLRKRGIYDVGDTCLTRKEQAYLAIQNLVRNKVSWHEKIKDATIVERWREELREVAKLPVTPYDAETWTHRLRTCVLEPHNAEVSTTVEKPNRRGYGLIKGDEPVVRRYLEHRFGETLTPGDQKALEKLIETMRDEASISDDFLWPRPLSEWNSRGVFVRPEGPVDLIRRFWSDELFDFAIADSQREVADCESFAAGPPQVVPAGVRKTYQADNYITPSELADLKAFVSKLEDVPEHKKDWHPGSKQQVLDLVHPSLFCFIKGVTATLPEGSCSRDPSAWMGVIGSGAVSAEDPRTPSGGDVHHASPFSTLQVASDDFQWLPTDFDVDEAGSTVTPVSYINNMHPLTDADGYRAVTTILAKFTPLFERVATDLVNRPENRFSGGLCPYVKQLENPDYQLDPDDPDDDGLGEWDIDSEGPFHIDKLHPSVADVDTPLPPRDFVVSLKDSRMQVIVKLANIHLTPENPDYLGGSWHTEGTQYEGIIATGIYYYDSSNITTSRLAFRQSIGDGPEDYSQDAREAVKEVYGVESDLMGVQEIGSVEAIPGRCIAFPNIYQHRVEPFSLSDPTRHGHRKILAFFLVDPSVPRLGTKDVPPQNAEWLIDQARDLGAFKNLPEDVVRTIVRKNLLTLAQAKEHREALMKARAASLVETADGSYFAESISLCEH
ncbi:hypothetical protein HKX48_006196 [Thoreauomyces humboldtii]|nr:hypothetical protein HKX48_006196 [Thoreauomyces humboldtii]